jgi:hypothetical protein
LLVALAAGALAAGLTVSAALLAVFAVFAVLAAGVAAGVAGATVAAGAGVAAFAGLLAVLFAGAAPPQAMPIALRPRTVESTITFVILFKTPIFLKE